VNSNRAEFLFALAHVYPNSRFSSYALGGDSILGRRANHGFFQHTQVPNHIAPDFTKIQDGITYNLAWPVVSNVAAAAGLIKLHALLPEDVLAYKQMLTLSVAALRNNVRMLAKQQNIFDGVRFSRGDKALLQRVRVSVSN
jgi:hypothetical protein